jgi:U3 small nucleolar RNA-associated protein 12
MAVSPSGNFVLTGSHDRSLRIWEKTSEPLNLEEEKEMVNLIFLQFVCH